MNYVKNILRIRGNNMLSKELFVKVINGLEKFEKTALEINESLKDYFMDFNIIPSYPALSSKSFNSLLILVSSSIINIFFIFCRVPFLFNYKFHL